MYEHEHFFRGTKFLYDNELTKNIKHDLGDGNFGFYYNSCEYKNCIYRFGDFLKVQGFWTHTDRFVYVGYITIKQFPDNSVHLM
jgi:hypothetical protein